MTNCGSGASEDANNPSGVAPGVGIQGVAAVDDARDGEAVRVDVGELRSLDEVQQQIGVPDDGDRRQTGHGPAGASAQKVTVIGPNKPSADMHERLTGQLTVSD